MIIKPGDVAPDFTLPTHDGKQLALRSLRGHKVLLWFYIEASTPDCTVEARVIFDHREYFAEFNVVPIGVSFDDPDRNAEFAQKIGFRFPLLSDCDRTVALAYGACRDPKARTPDRTSVLIDEEGNVARVYDQVNPRDHAARVLADIVDEPAQ